MCHAKTTTDRVGDSSLGVCVNRNGARPSTGECPAASSRVARARGAESSRSGRPRVVRRPARSGREEGRGVQRPQLDCAENVVGPSEPAGHLVDRRHAWHSLRPPGSARHARVPERGAVHRAREASAGRQRARGQRTDVPSRRVWHARVRFLVARRRSAERPRARADGRRTRASRRCRRQRLVRPGSVRHVRGFLAVRPLHRAQLERRHERRALRQRHRDRAEPGQRHDHVRDGARDARDSARRPAASRGRRARSTTATRAAIGTATRSSSRPAASRTRRASAPAHRTARACGRRSASVESIRT